MTKNIIVTTDTALAILGCKTIKAFIISSKGYLGLSVVHLRGTPSSNEMCRGRKQAAPHTQSVSVSNSDPVLDSRAFLDSEVLGRGASRG